MGREVRRVPAGWEHPKDARGRYIPLHEGRGYKERLAEWVEASEKWAQGLQSDYAGGWIPKGDAALACESFEEWDGLKPKESDYMPDWPDSERTHLQMYEDTTEGTPISPVMSTPEDLARWLCDNRASAFGTMVATYEQWLATIKAGWAPGLVIGGGVMSSGVAHYLERE